MAVSGKRKVKIEIGADAGGMDTGIADAKRKLRAMKREQEKAAKDADRAKKKKADDRAKAAAADRGAVAGFGKSMVHGLAAAAGFDLAGGLGGMFEDVFDTEREMTRFGIDAQLSKDKLNGFRDELMKTSEATGVSRNSLVKGAHAYQILTGDAEGAVKASALFADVANASGASMEDIAATAASLKQNLGFDPSEFRKGFDVLLSMGHLGSVELRDLAGQMAGLAPQFKDFGQGSATDKLAEMGATMQVIRKNFGDASEMATGFRSLMTAITKKQGSLEKYGVQVFKTDPNTGKLVKNDFLQIVGDILKNPALNDKILPKLLGRQEAVRALGAMRDHWDEIAQLQANAANSDQVSKDAHQWMDSASGRIAKAWEHIKNAIAEALTPERIDQFASALTTAADAFAKVVGFASQSIDAIRYLTGNGAPGDADAKNAEQVFLEQSNSGGANDEKEAIAHARKVALANSLDDLSPVDQMNAAAYGGLKPYQGGARLYLANEDKNSGAFRGADGGLGEIDNQTTANAFRMFQAYAGTNQIDPKVLASAFAQALKDAGFGTAKVPNETVAGAASRAITIRTGNHR